MDRDKLKNQEPGRQENLHEQPPRSSAFNEQSTKDQKSTHNPEQETGLVKDNTQEKKVKEQ